MKNLTLLICLLFVQQCTGQSAVVRKELQIVSDGETRAVNVILPKSLEPSLSKLQRMNGFAKAFPTPNDQDWKRTEIVIRVSKYVESETRKTGTGIEFGPMISHRAWYPAIVGENTTYVFLEDDVTVDTEMFNQFRKDSGIMVTTTSQAIAIVDFYFSAARGYFENKGKQILSSVSDIPNAGKKGYESETEKLKNIVVPREVRAAQTGFKVECYTWEILKGEITWWTFVIPFSGPIEVESTIVGQL